MARSDGDDPSRLAATSEANILMERSEKLGVEGVDDVELVVYVLGQMKMEIRYPLRVLEMVFSRGGGVRDRSGGFGGRLMSERGVGELDELDELGGLGSSVGNRIVVVVGCLAIVGDILLVGCRLPERCMLLEEDTLLEVGTERAEIQEIVLAVNAESTLSMVVTMTVGEVELEVTIDVPTRHMDKQESVLVRRKVIKMSYPVKAPPVGVCCQVHVDNNHPNSVDEPAMHRAQIQSLDVRIILSLDARVIPSLDAGIIRLVDARIGRSHKEAVPEPWATMSSVSDPFPEAKNAAPVLLPHVRVEYRNIASVTKPHFFDD
jgi:hypothetical protein